MSLSAAKTLIPRNVMDWAANSKLIRKGLHKTGLRTLGHDTLIWIREDGSHHSRITFPNYFSMNYKIPSPSFSFGLFDAEGNYLGGWKELSKPDGSIVVDSQDLVQKFGLQLPFEGNLSAEVEHQDLFPRRYLRCNVDYYQTGGYITTVHDQGRFIHFPDRDAHTLVHVIETPESETGIVVRNGYRYKSSPLEFTAKVSLEIINKDGETRRSSEVAIPSCGTRTLWLSELFKNSIGFFGGLAGGVRIYSNIRIPRSIAVIKSRTTGQISVNHTCGDNDPTIYDRWKLKPEDVPDKVWAPVWSSFVEETQDLNTQFSLFNNWLPRETYDIDIRLFDSDGEKVANVPNAFSISPDEPYVLSMDNFLNSCGLGTPFRGNIEARIAPKRNVDWLPGPGALQVNTIWSNNQSIAITNNQSLWYYNSPLAPDRTDWKDRADPSRFLMWVGSTRMFGRVVSNVHQETLLSLINASSHEDYSVQSETRVTIKNSNGEDELQASLLIPPHGSVLLELDELFPDLGSFLKSSDGISTLHVIDKKVKLSGYIMLRDRQSGAIGVDHLFGG